MKKMLIATRGKIFVADNLPLMVEHPRLRAFSSDLRKSLDPGVHDEGKGALERLSAELER